MIEKILEKYNLPKDGYKVDNINAGNINRTFILEYPGKKYLVQKINNAVFTEPYKLMKNIEGVTKHLNDKLSKIGDTEHKALNVIRTKDNSSLAVINDGMNEKSYYRIYEYIENSISYDCSENLDIVYNTGKAFGNFQKLLNDYPIHKLEETIKDFHNTEKRFRTLIQDIKIDSNERVMNVAPELIYLLQKSDNYGVIMDLLKNNEIPYRVTHNDTKVNNVMMNKETGNYLTVIDLDTVMPGSMLFDYGDGVRSTASKNKEDDPNYQNACLDIEMFKSYTRGYLSEMADYLTPKELEMMPSSILIIALELAIRFIDDYINGDTYFKIEYNDHNLVRARNQIFLAKDIENKMPLITDFINQEYQNNIDKAKERLLIKKPMN